MRDHIFHKVFIPRNVYSEKYEGIKCFVLFKNCFSLKWIILLTKECIYYNKSLDDKGFYLKLDLLFIKTLKLNTVWIMRWFLKGIEAYPNSIRKEREQIKESAKSKKDIIKLLMLSFIIRQSAWPIYKASLSINHPF